jgi:ubiquitin-conjugating enzyme E2 R
MASSALVRLLQNQYKNIQKEPVEGLFFEPDESNLQLWKIWVEGSKGTPYEGGIYQLQMTFPDTYPMEPPELRFISEFWHPNVYKDGKVCISILHPPGEDAMSGELPEERWLPTQTVTTVMLSVISMLSDPNISSPANVDSSVEWRDRRQQFNERCKALAEKSTKLVPAHVVIPHPETNAAEKKAALERRKILEGGDNDFMMDYSDEDDDVGGDDIDYDEMYVDDEDYGSDIVDDDEEGSDVEESEEESEEDTKKKKKEEPKKVAEAPKTEDKKKLAQSSEVKKDKSSSKDKSKDKKDKKEKSTKEKEKSKKSKEKV